MNNFLRILVLCTVFLVLTGCGVKTAYNNADWLLMRWVDDRVDLTDEQKRDLRTAIDEHLAWHCADELPRYAAFLQRVDDDVVDNRLTATAIESYGEQVSGFGRRLLLRVRPTAVDLLSSLNDEQVAQLMESFEERNRELLEEAETYSTEATVRERAEGFEKGMRRFTGRLTEAQRERLLRWAEDLDPTAELALQRRLDWQAAFVRLMQLRDDRARFDEAIVELLQPDGFISETYERRRQRNRESTIRTLAEIHAMAPERQVEEVRENLADFSEDLEQLSCS